MTTLNLLERSFLIFCADDYTGVDFVLRDVELTYPLASPGEHRIRTLELIKKMLELGYVQAGHYPEPGGNWAAWDLTIEETIRKISLEWDKFGKERKNLIDIVWFVSTVEGDRALERAKPRNEL